MGSLDFLYGLRSAMDPGYELCCFCLKWKPYDENEGWWCVPWTYGKGTAWMYGKHLKEQDVMHFCGKHKMKMLKAVFANIVDAE